MLSDALKKMMLGGASAAVLMLSAPAAQATTTIYVGVAANFATPLSTLIDKFKTAYPTPDYDYDVIYTSTSSGNLLSQITGSCATTPTCSTLNPNAWGHYDLFLSADATRPQVLYTSYPSLVTTWTSTATTASAYYVFNYANGYLDLWTHTSTAADVSSGLPTTWTSVGVGIANPANAPYGYAAQQVLANVYGVTLPSSYVTTYADIGAIYNAVNAGTQVYGFVARSQICSNGNTSSPTYSPYSHQDIAPGAGTYSTIVQNGVKIANTSARTRSSDEELLLTRFVDFLMDHSTSPDSDAVDTLKYYCYAVP